MDKFPKFYIKIKYNGAGQAENFQGRYHRILTLKHVKNFNIFFMPLTLNGRQAKWVFSSRGQGGRKKI